jgi:hypothetical protein
VDIASASGTRKLGFEFRQGIRFLVFSGAVRVLKRRKKALATMKKTDDDEVVKVGYKIVERCRYLV